MLVWVVFAVAYVVCIAIFVWAMRAAPRGYEDERGFHFGSEPQTDPYVDRQLRHQVSAPEVHPRDAETRK